MRKRSKKTLSKIMSLQGTASVCNSYDIVGDIAIAHLPESEKESQRIAETILSIHKNVKTVLAQSGGVCGEFRLRGLKYVAGENKTTTFHRESGCLFSVDVEKCYFSPRLSYERVRIAKQVQKDEVVVNMFAGVGCFSILIAKHANPGKVYSIDVNPTACECMERNVRINKVYGKVVPLLGDAKDLVERKLCGIADRVLMPLPEKAFHYLPVAVSALNKRGGWVHYYDFEHASKEEDASEKVKKKVLGKLADLEINCEVSFARVVRSVGPNWYQVVLDVRVLKDGTT